MADFGDYAGQYLTMARDAPRTAAALMQTDAELQKAALERPGLRATAALAPEIAQAQLQGTPFQQRGQNIQQGQLALAQSAGERANTSLQEEMRANRVKEAISAYTADPLGLHPELHSGGIGGSGGAVQVAKGQQGAVGIDFLKSLPIPMQQQVKAIADGKMAPPSGFALKTPYWQQMMSAVGQYDPSFDLTNWSARSKTLNDFTSGKSFQNLNAINTAIGHLNTLFDASTALNNGNLPLVNSITNFVSNQLGKPQVKNFDMAKNAVGDELMRVFRQVGANQQEAENWKKTLDSSGSPEQFSGAIKTAAELLESRIGSLNEGFKQGMGKPADTLAMVYPKSRQTLEMLKSGGQQQKAIAPEDQAAIAWAKANPNDPRASQILRLHGG